MTARPWIPAVALVLLTARSLLPVASTAAELQLARQAERLANHEVDLAFTEALPRAAGAQTTQTPAQPELASLKAKAQALVDTDRQLMDRLQKQLATACYRVRAFSTAPGLTVVATTTGVEICNRYISRATERYETRLRLNQAEVELMHGPRGEAGLPGGKA